ncbi:hypothetical protein BpHYR1_024412 [Brachionus plicatilis]|uniref:Uncharacterized protein n=1 Tax=Brachionus plicatilis TaxID=10195 RepID=A0A3M7PXY7_BRAPC|nr:hypothetical protein BpHYR1_024412 [Brachionus plicatilis]
MVLGSYFNAKVCLMIIIVFKKLLEQTFSSNELIIIIHYLVSSGKLYSNAQIIIKNFRKFPILTNCFLKKMFHVPMSLKRGSSFMFNAFVFPIFIISLN